MGLGDSLQFSENDFAGAIAGTSSTSGGFSLKDAWRSRSTPSRPFSQVEVELLASTYCFAGRTE